VATPIVDRAEKIGYSELTLTPPIHSWKPTCRCPGHWGRALMPAASGSDEKAREIETGWRKGASFAAQGGSTDIS